MNHIKHSEFRVGQAVLFETDPCCKRAAILRPVDLSRGYLDCLDRYGNWTTVPYSGWTVLKDDTVARHTCSYVRGFKHESVRGHVTRIGERKYQRILNVSSRGGYHKVSFAITFFKGELRLFRGFLFEGVLYFTGPDKITRYRVPVYSVNMDGVTIVLGVDTHVGSWKNLKDHAIGLWQEALSSFKHIEPHDQVETSWYCGKRAGVTRLLVNTVSKLERNPQRKLRVDLDHFLGSDEQP